MTPLTAINATARFYVSMQLGLAVQILRREIEARDHASPATRRNAALGFLYMLNVNAWQRFCGELGIYPDEPMGDLPGAMELPAVEKLVSQLAPEASDIEAIYTREFGPGQEIPTAESTLVMLRADFNKWLHAI